MPAALWQPVTDRVDAACSRPRLLSKEKYSRWPAPAATIAAPDWLSVVFSSSSSSQDHSSKKKKKKKKFLIIDLICAAVKPALMYTVDTDKNVMMWNKYWTILKAT